MLYIGTSEAQIYNTEIEAKITIEETYNVFHIKASASNKTEINQSLRYELSVIKGAITDSVKNRESESGRFVLAANEQVNVAETVVKRDSVRTILLLLLYNSEEKLLGKDRIVLNEAASEDSSRRVLKKQEEITSPDAVHTEADGVVLRGIVIEDTKTKLGSDFYRMFYSEYLQKHINGKEIITIKEELAIGNNTKIEILAGRELYF